ncbi:hypothetical protein B0H13DRAFT_2663233 [Mycena leptocephala]|nr:hypothetical protein B0H13DRAFT_2663233 [Mycena leptocephala]
MSVPLDVVQALGDLEKVRLVSAAGLVILIYDHLLSLPDEVRLVWSAKFTSSKILFLALRYCVPIVMIVHTVQLAGLSNITLPDTVCKVWYTISILVGWLAFAINDWLVLLRLWILWDRNRTLILCTLFVFIASNTTVFVLTIFSFTSVIPNSVFIPVLDICAPDKPFVTTHFRVLWLPEVLFQLMTVCALGWKIHLHPQTFNALLRDGYLYFLCLFGKYRSGETTMPLLTTKSVINLVNQIVVFVVRPTLLFLTALFVWCFTTTATCRMILSLRGSSYRAQDIEPSEDSGTEYHSTAHLELSERHQSSSTTRAVETPTRERLIDTRSDNTHHEERPIINLNQ